MEVNTLLDESQEYLTTDPSTNQSKALWALDIRLVKALKKLDFIHPTFIQAKAIPLALEGKDLLIKAKTGSGKTIAYLIPLLQRLLQSSKTETSRNAERVRFIDAVVLLPSNELAHQIVQVLQRLMKYCQDKISILNLNMDSLVVAVKKVLKLTKSSVNSTIVVATPGRLLKVFEKIEKKQGKTTRSDGFALKQKLKLSLKVFALDEADLMCEYEYKDDLEVLSKQYLPSSCQSFIISATLLSEKKLKNKKAPNHVEEALKNLNFLKSLVLHNPAILTLKDQKPGSSGGVYGSAECITNLNQFYVVVKDATEKDLLLYVLLKLGLVNGKILFFVNSTDASYRYQLLFEQFCITKCIVLNSLLPLNNRLGKIDLFNKGLVDLVLAADSSSAAGATSERNMAARSEKKESNAVSFRAEDETEESREQEEGKEDVEDDSLQQGFNVSRGLDFKEVSFVVNLEMPASVEDYIHRVGRTARAGMFGTSLSIIQADRPEEVELLEALQQYLPRKMIHNEEKVQPSPLALDMKELDPFRYRVNDVRRRVTKQAIEDMRLKELKLELLTNEKVKKHFEVNPTDLTFLTAAKASSLRGVQVKKVTSSVGSIPSYLLPSQGANKGQETLASLDHSLKDTGMGKRKKNKKRAKGRFSKKLKRKRR